MSCGASTRERSVQQGPDHSALCFMLDGHLTDIP
jgi:hypothetical protein